MSTQPPTSLVMGRQGFDCVIKGFRVGRQARRPHWSENVVIYYDPQQNTIMQFYPNGSIGSWDPDYPAQDFMAQDWEIWG